MKPVHADKAFPELVEWFDDFVAIRHEIHQNPELGFDTKYTTGSIVRPLNQWGSTDIDTQIVPGGVIAVVEGNRPGATIAIRADIDALPMDDCSSNPWKSQIDGHAHACGHDGHQTWLMATLRYLNAKKDFPGRVVGIFQPAEEIGKGADAVVKAGVLEKYGVKEIYGAHTEPMLPKGQYGFKSGPLQASADSFWITVDGIGTHGGRPHLGVDPIPAGAQIVLALQTVISRKLNPVIPGVLSVCSINAGRFETVNVVPHKLTISGTVRTFAPEARKMIEEKLRSMVEQIASANDCKANVVWEPNCAAVINDAGATAAGIQAATELYGAENVVPELAPFMSSEDFSSYQEKIPGAMMRIGVKDENHTCSVHNQAFDFNDEVIPAAATLFATIAKKRLEALS